MDPCGAETALSLAFPLPLCPGGVRAGGLPQYLPLGWVDKGGGLPANLRLMATNDAGPKSHQTYVVVAKNQHINSWLHDGQKLWIEKKMGFKFLTAWLSETWAWTENYVVVATSERPVPDCMIVRGLNLKENRTSTSWLHDCQKLEPEMKTEHQLPDRMLVRNLVLAWNRSSISWLGIHEKLRGLLNTSWWLSFIQHAWNHCESWDVWYVKQIIGTCCPDSDPRPTWSKLMSDSDTKNSK